MQRSVRLAKSDSGVGTRRRPDGDARMSERLPRITATDLLQALRRAGWMPVRQTGAHLVLHHPDRPGRIVLPMHTRKTIPPGTLSSILKEAGLTADDLRRLL